MKALVLAVICACGAADPGLRLDKPAKLAVAADLDWADTTFAGHDVKLYAQRWRPKSGDVRAVIVIHHGLADHSSRYAPFAERLARAGFAVWAFDMRGHGRSAGVRVSATSIDDFLDDLDAFIKLVREREPGKPIYLFGHSLGGLITSLYVIERQPPLAGLVLSGPGIAFDAPPLQAAVVRMIAGIAPNAPVLDTPHGDFSTSADVIAGMNDDPLIFQGKGPARTARAAIDGTARVWAAPERITVPLLVVTGSIDKLVAPSGGRDLVARAGGTDKTFLLYDNFNHDLLHEPNGGNERVMGDIQTWLDAHAAGQRSAQQSTVVGALKGDRSPGLLAVDLDLRGERTSLAGVGTNLGVSAGLRFRLGIGDSIGYFGGLDIRGGHLGINYFEADLHALGLAVRNRAGCVAAITGGIGIGGVRGISATHIPVELTLEVPLGPVHALARAGLGWRLSGDRYGGNAHGLADEANAMLGIRIGRDVAYWANVIAGAGPYLAVTYRDVGGGEAFGVAIGADLFGAN